MLAPRGFAALFVLGCLTVACADGGSNGNGNGGGGSQASGPGGGAGGPGSGGDGGSPPVQVADCDGLAEEGTWETVGLPVAADYDSTNVTLDPLHSGTAYVGAFIDHKPGFEGAGLWKTQDCGATWKNINTGTNGDRIQSNATMVVGIDRKNSDLIYAVVYTQGLWRSENGGVDWADITPQDPDVPAWVQGASMDRNDAKHLLSTPHNDCTGQYAPMCLSESFDGGETWRHFKGPTEHWQEGAGPLLIDATTMLFAAPFYGLFWSGNAGKDWEEVGPGCFADLQLGSDGKYYLGCKDHVMVSDDAHTWTVVEGSGPTVSLGETGKYWYGSYTNDFSGQPIYRAAKSDLGTWEHLATPAIGQGTYSFAYDAPHELLFASQASAGLWRVRTK